MSHGLNFSQLYPGRFISAAEMGGRKVTLTIKDVNVEELEKEDGTVKATAILSFSEIKRDMVLNRTNGLSIRAMFGDNIDDWFGRRITIYPERDTSGLSETGVCLRVYGSPDLKDAITAQIKLPRRRPVPRKLVPTGKDGHGDADVFADEAACAAANVDPITGEVAETPVAPAETPEASVPPDEPAAPSAATQAPQDADDDGPIPGRGALFDSADGTRPATNTDKRHLSEALKHVPESVWQAHLNSTYGKSRQDLTHDECAEFTAWAVEMAVAG